MTKTRSTHSRPMLATLGTFVAVTLGVATIARAANDVTSHWREDFEGRAVDAVVNWDGWEPSDSSVIVQHYVVYDQGAQAGDSKAAYIPPESALTNRFTGAAVSRVWTEMYVQPTLESAYVTNEPTVDPTSTAFFYFNSNGYAKVWNGDHWEELSTTASGAAASPYQSGWVRVTVYQNYSNQRWALFTNKVLLAEQLHFNSAASGYNHFALRNGTYLDMCYVDTWFPTNGSNDAHSWFDNDNDGDGSGDIWEMHYFTSASTYGAGSDTDNDGQRNEEEYANLTDPTSALSVDWMVPYFQTFESGSGTVSGTWKGVNGSGTVCSIQSSSAVQGSKALCLSTGEVSFTVTTADAADTNVWVQVYSKPGVYYDNGGPPSVGADTAAAFYVQRGTGILKMYDGNAWVEGATVPTNAWLGLAVHLDYVAGKWSLYASTNGFYGEVMQRAHDGILDMNSSCTQVCFHAMAITTELPTYIDAIAVSEGYDPVSSLHTNLMVQERIANASTLTALPPYEYVDDQLEMGGMLGTHLARGRKLTAGSSTYDADVVKVLSSGTWRPFFLDELTGEWEGTGLYTYRATNSVNFVRRPGTDFATFYPYTNAVSGSYYEITLQGADGDLAGWNMISWPPTYPGQNINPYTKTDLPTDGYPEIWLYRNQGYIRLYWSTSRGSWMDTRQRPVAAANLVLAPGEGFWYRRHENGTTTWTPATN